MPWYTLEEAAIAKKMSPRNVFRLVEKKKLMSRKNEGTTEIWIDDAPQSSITQSANLSIPEIRPSKLTDEIMTKIDIMLKSITPSPTGEGWGEVEERLDTETGLPAGTQRRWKADLRELYHLPPRSPLSALCSHPQIKQALAYVIIRKAPSNAGEMRSAKNLSITYPTTGEVVSVQDYLLSLYSHKNHNAKSCHLALVQAVREKRLLNETTGEPASMEDLPSEASVRRFVREEHKSSRALRRSRMSRSERIADRVYISRPDDEYRPGGKLEGDHTEDVTMVYRNDGKAAPLWTTMLVDVRTGMIKSYVHSYYPSSNTIALAYRNAVLGTQIEIAVDQTAPSQANTSLPLLQGEGKGGVVYQPLGIVDAPDLLVYDNGKDYKSKFSGQVTGWPGGKIDFNDEARRCVQLISEMRHTGRRLPQAKGHVEGTFHIIQETMLKYLPGYKGSNYSGKPDELAAQVRDGVLLTEDQYKELFKRVVNTLNNRTRKSLGDLSPLQFYLANQQQTRVVDERVLDFLMMKMESRKISRGYVRIFSEEYFSMDLDEQNGKYCSLYYDPAEMGRMAVYIDGQFITFAVNKKLLGTCERDLLRIVKQRAQQNKDIAEEIRAMRAGLTSEDAKAILFNAELNNVVSIKAEMLQKKVPTIVTLTGIEHQAKNLQVKLDIQKRTEEVEKKRDDAKNQPMRIINLERLK